MTPEFEGRRARALMVLGTASHVGKSLITAAFCRLLAEAGCRVAPFKAQNMALNSFITPEGAEIGRSQAAQAEAAGIPAHVDMNPILLKPMDGVCQVVLEGEPIGVMSAGEYYAAKPWIWPRVAEAYDRLAARFDTVVLEGAGSPVEINLTEHDLTNLRMARHADAAVVLVAEIDRGGVFAQIIGTWELLEPEDRPRVCGFVINKFRGDVAVLDSGLAEIQRRTGVPVLGVLPYRPDLQIEQEDSMGVEETGSAGDLDGQPVLDVVVPRVPGLSNFTDFWPLSRVPGIRLRYVERGIDFGRPDLVVLPGSKTTVRDLEWLRNTSLADRVVEAAGEEDGPIVLGICGGYQMLGKTIDDPLGIESTRTSVEGLGLLDVRSTFAPAKARYRVSGTVEGESYAIAGYEIHMGETERGGEAMPWILLRRDRGEEVVHDGAREPRGRVFGTYVHGLFDSAGFTSALVDRLRRRRGWPPLDRSDWQSHREMLAERYAGLAQLLRDHLDLAPIWSAMGRSDGARAR